MHRSSLRLAIIAAAGLCLVVFSLLFPRLAERGYAAPSQAETVPKLLLAKDDGVASVQPGERITYTLTYTNTINGAWPSVVLTETVPINTRFVITGSSATWSCPDGSPAGTTCTLDLNTVTPLTGGTKTFVVQVLDPLTVATSNVQNTITIGSSGTFVNEATIQTPLDTDIDFNFTKDDQLLIDADSNGIASPGDTLRYTLSLTLMGNAPVTGVTLVDNPGPVTNLKIGSVTTNNGTIDSGNDIGDTAVQINLGDMTSGDSAQVVFDVVVKNPLPSNVTQVANQAFLSGDNIPTTPSDDPATGAAGDATVTSLLAGPELAASKDDELLVDADSSGDPSPGDTLRYHVVLSNNGNQSLAGVKFQDTLDPNTQLVPGSVTASQGLITTSSSSVSVDVGTLTGDGGQVAIDFSALIAATVPNGVTEISNQGIVSSAVLPDLVTDDPDFEGSFDPTRTAITADAQIYLTLRDLLYGDTDGDQVVSEGDTLLYIARLFNNGNQAAVNLTYDHIFSPQLQLLPGTVTVDTAVISKGNGNSDSSVQVKLDELQGGDSILVTYLVKVMDTGSLTKLTTQSQATYTNGIERRIVSDDPNTTTPFDPTVTIIGNGQPAPPAVYLPLAARPVQ